MSRHVGGSGVPSFDAPRSAWMHACTGADPSSGAATRPAATAPLSTRARGRRRARGLVALLAPRGSAGRSRLSAFRAASTSRYSATTSSRDVFAKIVVVVGPARVGSSVEPGALVQPEPRGRVVDVARVDAERVGLVRVAVVVRGRRDDGCSHGRGPRRDHGRRVLLRQQRATMRARATTPA